MQRKVSETAAKTACVPCFYCRRKGVAAVFRAEVCRFFAMLNFQNETLQHDYYAVGRRKVGKKFLKRLSVSKKLIILQH